MMVAHGEKVRRTGRISGASALGRAEKEKTVTQSELVLEQTGEAPALATNASENKSWHSNEHKSLPTGGDEAD